MKSFCGDRLVVVEWGRWVGGSRISPRGFFCVVLSTFRYFKFFIRIIRKHKVLMILSFLVLLNRDCGCIGRCDIF